MKIKDFTIGENEVTSYTNVEFDLDTYVLKADILNGKYNEIKEGISLFGELEDGEDVTFFLTRSRIYNMSSKITQIEFHVELLVRGDHVESFDKLHDYNLRIEYSNASTFLHLKEYAEFNIGQEHTLQFRKKENNLVVEYIFNNNFEYGNLHNYIVQVNTLLSFCSNEYIKEDSVHIIKDKKECELIFDRIRYDQKNRDPYFYIYEGDLTNDILENWDSNYKSYGQVIWSIYDYLGAKTKSYFQLLAMFRNIEIIMERAKSKDVNGSRVNHTKLRDLNISKRFDFYARNQKLQLKNKFNFMDKVIMFLNITNYIHELNYERTQSLAKQIKDRRNSLTHEGKDTMGVNNIEPINLMKFLFILLRAIILEDTGINNDIINNNRSFHENLIKHIETSV